MAFVWTKEMSVRVEEIDEQHRQFFRLANEVLALAEEPSVSKTTAFHLLDQFLNYAQFHLSTEETYFDRCHYAEAEAHIQAHDFYRKTVIEARERLDAAEEFDALLSDLALFAGQWLTEHIRVMDQRYIESFHKCGLS